MRRARVQAFKNASFCSWCLVKSWDTKATLSWFGFFSFVSLLLPHQSSSRLYSRSRLSRTEQTCPKNRQNYFFNAKIKSAFNAQKENLAFEEIEQKKAMRFYHMHIDKDII